MKMSRLVAVKLVWVFGLTIPDRYSMQEDNGEGYCVNNN